MEIRPRNVFWGEGALQKFITKFETKPKEMSECMETIGAIGLRVHDWIHWVVEFHSCITGHWPLCLPFSGSKLHLWRSAEKRREA